MRTRIKNLQQELVMMYEDYGLSSAIYAEYNEHLMHILVNEMYSEGALAMIEYISREINKLQEECHQLDNPDWDEVEFEAYISCRYSM